MKKLEKATHQFKKDAPISADIQNDLFKASGASEYEVYKNDLYTVDVRRGIVCGFGEEQKMTHLSIKRNDRRALPDWRHFQWIKNELVGEENEGIELYPAESRLVDGANQYHIWVFEDPKVRLPFGWDMRLVTEKPQMGETQRKFPTNRRPEDLEKNEAIVKGLIKKYHEKSNS